MYIHISIYIQVGSPGFQKVIELPVAPARPVRPIRCTYDSTSRAMSKLKTWLTWRESYKVSTLRVE